MTCPWPSASHVSAIVSPLDVSNGSRGLSLHSDEYCENWRERNERGDLITTPTFVSPEEEEEEEAAAGGRAGGAASRSCGSCRR